MPGEEEFPALGIDIPFSRHRAQLISLSEDDRERDLILSDPIQELQVDLLGIMAYIDQNEKAGKLLTVEDIALY